MIRFVKVDEEVGQEDREREGVWKPQKHSPDHLKV